MIASLLAFGGVVFWVVIALYILAVVITIEENNEGRIGLPIVWTVVLGLVAYIFYKEPLASFFTSLTLSLIVTYSLLYLSVGLFWSGFRWYRHLKYWKGEYDEEIKSANDYNATCGDNKWKRQLPKVENFMPKASKSKEQLSAWIIYWPFSMIRYIMGDLLVDFVNGITTALGGVYDRMAKRVFDVK